jgi:hypothetical protein
MKDISTEVVQLWCPSSLDLTPLEFYVWGFVRDENYVLPIGISRTSFKEQIRRAELTVENYGHAYSKKLT